MRYPDARPRRLLLMAAMAASLMITAVGPVAAYTPPNEVQTGQIAHYYVRDLTLTPIVTCKYTQHGSSTYRISSFVVKIPYVWWYDTNDADTHQHGTVGWQIKIQSSTSPYSTWHTEYTSSIEKATAYEDHPGYDSNDRAHFSKRTKSWNSTDDEVYRVKLILTWYKSNGSVKGTLTHWYQSYNGLQGPQSDFCVNKVHFT